MWLLGSRSVLCREGGDGLGLVYGVGGERWPRGSRPVLRGEGGGDDVVGLGYGVGGESWSRVSRPVLRGEGGDGMELGKVVGGVLWSRGYRCVH